MQPGYTAPCQSWSRRSCSCQQGLSQGASMAVWRWTLPARSSWWVATALRWMYFLKVLLLLLLESISGWALLHSLECICLLGLWNSLGCVYLVRQLGVTS